MPIFDNLSLIGKLSERIIGKTRIGFRTDYDPLLGEIPAYFQRCFQHCVFNDQVPMH
jgi:hypothetical protein